MDRVLEIGGYAAGYCGRLFVQTGHDVVRVECEPRKPAWVSGPSMDLFLHAGKRRVTIGSSEVIGQLAGKADIIVLDVDSADAVDAYGFDDWASKVKVAITPYGRTGPKRNWKATPNVLLAVHSQPS